MTAQEELLELFRKSDTWQIFHIMVVIADEHIQKMNEEEAERWLGVIKAALAKKPGWAKKSNEYGKGI